MRHVTRCLAVGIIVLAAACRENTPVQPRQPGSIQALIVDGAHSGNPHFFFLPPLVPNPSSFFTAGQFNAHLAPTVEVCQLAANPALGPTDCANGSLVFGPATMSLDAADELYQLNWDTKASALDATAFYRVTVRGAAQGTSLGSLDVDPVLGGMKNLKTGDVVVFQDGRTLPIKVRIENGAFGSTNSNDFVEASVPNVSTSGATVITTNTGFAGASFPNGWLPTINGVQLNQVVVIIERVPVAEGLGQTCLSSGLQEMEGCYRFRTDPDLHTLEATFAQNVTVGVCFEVPSAIGHENKFPFVLHKREEFNGTLVGPAILLPEAPAPFVHCDSFTPTPGTIGAALRAGNIGAAARASLALLSRGVSHFIEPQAAHAVDLGAGGSTDGFSRVGWAERDTMFVGPNVPTSAPAGSTIQATVQILAFHNPPPPVVGRLVTFTVTGANGTLVDGNGNATNSLQVPTDANGNATVSWRVGVGPNTLTASAAAVVDSPVPIVVTGTLGLLVRPVTTDFTAGFGVTLPLTQTNGISMQSGTGVQLEVSPTTTVSWSSSDPLGSNGSVNTTGLVAVVQGNNDPAVSHELDVTATGTAAAGTIQINSYAFSNFPRWTTLVWRPVTGAVSYDVDFQFGNGCTPGTAVCGTWTEHSGSPATTSSTGFVFGFVGAQPGRWRVTAHDANGAVLSTSEWVYFAYSI